MEVTFTNPVYLWFTVVIPLLILAHFLTLKLTRRKALKFANFPAIESVTGKKILSKNYLLLALRMITLILVILSVAGTFLWYEGTTTDFNFILAIDSSGSMLATDYTPNRLGAAKESASLFVNILPENSRVGVISFAGISFVKQMPTFEIDKVKKAVENITIEIVGGTAIGGAITTSVNLLTYTDKPNVIVLLTDGQNNVGPTIGDAVEYAKDRHVTVHTVGIGTEEGGIFENIPNTTFVSKLDINTLKYIANETGGEFYLAENETELSQAFTKIALTSKKKLYIDLSLYLLVTAMVLLFAEWGLVNTKYRTIP